MSIQRTGFISSLSMSIALVGLVIPGIAGADLFDESIDRVQRATFDLCAVVVHGHKNLRVLDEKRAHVCNVPFNGWPANAASPAVPAVEWRRDR